MIDNAAIERLENTLDKDQREMWKLAGKYMAVGTEMGVSVLIGFLVGDWIDGRFGTDPYGLYFFLCVGCIAAFKVLYRIAKNTNLDKL